MVVSILLKQTLKKTYRAPDMRSLEVQKLYMSLCNISGTHITSKYLSPFSPYFDIKSSSLLKCHIHQQPSKAIHLDRAKKSDKGLPHPPD